MSHRLAAAALLLVACGGPSDRPEALRSPAEILPGARGATVAMVTSRELEEIARLEDARALGDGRLFALLAGEREPLVRARAATALGRFPYPAFGSEVTEALARALEDPELEVRLAAAFALGVRADPASAGTLVAYCNDTDPRMRARVLEAVSKLADGSVPGQLALSLRDADLAVRMEAAVGTARLDPGAPGSAEVDRALLDALHPYRITRETAPKSAVEAELVWRILWALGRRKAELGRGPFLEYAGSEVVLERLFALRGLAQLPPDVAAVHAAIDALRGPRAAREWSVAYEAAVALGRFAAVDGAKLDPATRELLASAVPLDALEGSTEHPSAHVRSAAMEALASFGDGRRVLELLQRGRLDLSASVRAATLRARVRLAGPDDAMDALRRGAREDDPVLRAAAADAAGALRDPRAGEVLLELARDPSSYVATRAVEWLGQHPSDAVREALHAFLAHADNGMRLAAVSALKLMPSAADGPALALALESSTGDGSAEVAFNAVQALAAIGGDEARMVVESARSEPRPYVRAVARKLARERFGSAAPGPEPPFVPDRKVPVPGQDYPLWRTNPMVELTTSRGEMVFELFPAEAPIHVHNFVTLVESGHYAGLGFHRVVPNFVVQGGDYRGDGNGAKPYEGEALRAEFTPRKTTRGSLGMPRNEDPDSGGSQIFVTHLPTPHLDGRFTIFGVLRTGGDVLDQLEIGDRILSARVLP
jgi:cyclophilin family peptidyl-prolyl cis-trans isomerase/HEAT repeat protein